MEQLFKALQLLLCSSTTSIWGESILAIKYHNIKNFYREGKKWWWYLLWCCVDVCVVNSHFDVEGEQLPKFDATTVSCRLKRSLPISLHSNAKELFKTSYQLKKRPREDVRSVWKMAKQLFCRMGCELCGLQQCLRCSPACRDSFITYPPTFKYQ